MRLDCILATESTLKMNTVETPQILIFLHSSLISPNPQPSPPLERHLVLHIVCQSKFPSTSFFLFWANFSSMVQMVLIESRLPPPRHRWWQRASPRERIKSITIYSQHSSGLLLSGKYKSSGWLTDQRKSRILQGWRSSECRWVDYSATTTESKSAPNAKDIPRKPEITIVIFPHHPPRHSLTFSSTL